MTDLAEFSLGFAAVIMANAFGSLIRIPFRVMMAAADIDDHD